MTILIYRRLGSCYIYRYTWIVKLFDFPQKLPSPEIIRDHILTQLNLTICAPCIKNNRTINYSANKILKDLSIINRGIFTLICRSTSQQHFQYFYVLH